jgi:Holliday junction DNA helicase RuvB
MRPKKLDEIVGQVKAKEVIKVLINSSKQNKKSIPHILLSGGSGCGKTSFAQAIANECGQNFMSVNCAVVGKPSKLYKIIEDMADNDILFLDEIHGLSKKTCESIYHIMEDFCYYDEGYKVNIPKICVIGASTEVGSLPLPLKSRFKFTANLVPYTEEELVDVCQAVCEECGFKLTKQFSRVIAKTCRGIPRNMVNRAEWIYAYMTGNNLKTIDKDKLLDIIKLQGVNEDGLEDQDIKYLKILEECQSLGLDSIESKLNISKENISKIIEPYLIQKGFIEKSAGRGRSLSRKGKLYLKGLKNV